MLNLLGIVDALASSQPAPATHPQPNALTALMSILPWIVIFIVFFYFFIIRPQSKRAKEHRDLLASISKRDEVITNGGVVGKIVKISDDFVVLQVSDNVEMTFQKQVITGVLPKGTVKFGL